MLVDMPTSVPENFAIADSVLQNAAAFVKTELAGNDSSHDFFHIERVRNMAVKIARSEDMSEQDVRVIELAALLHDVKDWKYGGTESEARACIEAFLSEQGIPNAVMSRITEIIACIGFKNELKSNTTNSHGSISLEAAVVQDADRLDATGAIGIARSFTFGGRFERVLYDPEVPPRQALSKEQYMSEGHKATTINHFHEKLLKLKDLMKTRTGQQIAAKRHAFMEQYLQQFLSEWSGES
eukprot:jgi/Chrzof1/4410/Cz14g12040.t1